MGKRWIAAIVIAIVLAMAAVAVSILGAMRIEDRIALLDEKISALSQLEKNGAASGFLDKAAVSKNFDLRGRQEIVSVERADADVMTPVSLAHLGGGEYAIANYRNIYVFDPAARKAYAVAPPAVPVWNPTAVFYSPFYRQLFIANYSGSDILIASLVEGDPLSLRLDGRLQLEKGAAPEGVYVSDGGRFLAVADNDRSIVSIYERGEGSWDLRWTKPVPGAHGIAIVGGDVYAGGASTIVRFDVETGKELERTSQLAPGMPILFATCINPDRTTGGLVGSDAMSGRIFRLTRDLQPLEVFGANGPGFDNLSMPYCAIVDHDASIKILSTYQDRLVEIGKEETTSFEFGERWTEDGVPYAADVWKGLSKFDHPGIDVFGQRLQANYGGLRAADGTLFMMPDRASLWGAGSARTGTVWPYYGVTSASDGHWIALASNSAPGLLLINNETEDVGVVDLAEWDCWAGGTAVRCPSRSLQVSELVARATIVKGRQTFAGTAAALGVEETRLLSEFTSAAGRKYLSNRKDPAAADTYFREAAGKPVPLMEYWLVRQASRATK